MLLAPQEALPRLGVRTLTSPLVCVPKLEEDAVAVRVWEVEACFSEPATLYEFRGEWEEIGRDSAVLLLGSGTLRFLVAGEDHEVVDAAPYWELKANASSDRTWCWRVFDRSAGEPITRNFGLKFRLQGDCLLLQCLSR